RIHGFFSPADAQSPPFGSPMTPSTAFPAAYPELYSDDAVTDAPGHWAALPRSRSSSSAISTSMLDASSPLSAAVAVTRTCPSRWVADSAPRKGSIVALSAADASGSGTDQKTSGSAVPSGWMDASSEAEAYGSTIRSGPVTVISSASTGCSPADSDSD